MILINHSVALILSEHRPLSTYPSVYNSAELLSRAGYDVHLLIPEDMEIDHDLGKLKILRFNKKRPSVYFILKTLLFCPFKYDLLIPYLQDELIAAGIVGTILKIPYIYFSLEIIGFDQSINPISRIKKYLEILLNKKALFTVVQDEARKDLIAKIHKIDGSRIFQVPNSYIGLKREKSDYLREKFKIPDDQFIVLYAGAIESWAIDASIIEAAKEWSDDFVLIMHGFSRDNYIQELIPLINEANLQRTKIILSREVLQETEYFKLVSSADIGLAWYKKEVPTNVLNMGLSSGKIAAFLRCGLPIIIPYHLKGISGHVGEYKFGIAVRDVLEIENALNTIIEVYDFYQKNAFEFFMNQLDYEKYFNCILEEIRHVIDK